MGRTAQNSSKGMVKVLGLAVPNWVGFALDVTGFALIGLFLWGFVDRNFRSQCDLTVYRFAGLAVKAGLDPYFKENLTKVAGHPVFPFLYPPLALLPCIAIAPLPWVTVRLAWMWFKIGTLAVLIVAWAKLLLKHEMVLPMALAAVFGWNASAQLDLRTGNVVIIEAALVWAALACFIAGRRRVFAGLIVVAAIFKLAPAAFLTLLLLPTEQQKPSWKLFVASGLALAGVVFGPMLAGPAAHLRPFWAGIPNMTTMGPDNPTLVGFTIAMLRQAGWTGVIPSVAYMAIWCVFSASIIGVSWPFLRRSYAAQDARRWAVVGVFLYSILLPRPMAYGFVLVAPAPFYFAPKPFSGPVGRWVLALAIAAQGLFRLTSNSVASPVAVYAPILLMTCLWLLVVNEAPPERSEAVRLGPTDGAGSGGSQPLGVKAA